MVATTTHPPWVTQEAVKARRPRHLLEDSPASGGGAESSLPPSASPFWWKRNNGVGIDTIRRWGGG